VAFRALGTNGSLAFWRTSGTVAGGNVGSGALGLTPAPGCTARRFTRTGGPSAYEGTTYPGRTTNGSIQHSLVLVRRGRGELRLGPA
jgi:hypothetical protein